ncbi:MAG: hypothetical protein HeimC3_29170 [Candidatus Heimdallarchaeota archaeon LC_3]|nr:MAG: hypothetical protein HeimC3_29170 [Candidatus Heimdallarchaeota archaeon LC_3]
MNEHQFFTKIRWKIHLLSSSEKIYRFLNSNEGRSKFWAENSLEKNNKIYFEFPNGYKWVSDIIERIPYKKFKIKYIDNSITTFELIEDENGGTNIELIDENVKMEWKYDVLPGWVSVLLNLKAAVDYGIDLRNHDKSKTWDEGFCDN